MSELKLKLIAYGAWVIFSIFIIIEFNPILHPYP